jgi:uncharacterized membrane protein
MTILILSLLIGVVAGLRAMTAPAAVAWAAHLGGLSLAGTPLAFMGHVAAAWLSAGSAGWSATSCRRRRAARSRCSSARILTGALSAAIAAPSGRPRLVAGVVGAVIGTFGGAAARRSGAGLRRDLPAALIETRCDRRRLGDRLLGALGAARRAAHAARQRASGCSRGRRPAPAGARLDAFSGQRRVAVIPAGRVGRRK